MNRTKSVEDMTIVEVAGLVRKMVPGAWLPDSAVMDPEVHQILIRFVSSCEDMDTWGLERGSLEDWMTFTLLREAAIQETRSALVRRVRVLMNRQLGHNWN